MSNNSLYAIGSVPKFVVRRKDTGAIVEFNHINGAESDIKRELFQAKASGIPAVSFLKPASGKLKIMAETTTDYIRQQIYNLGLTEAGANSGIKLYKALELKTDVTGSTVALTTAQIPVVGTMKVYSADRSVEYKVSSGVPVIGEYKFDGTTKKITLGGVTAITDFIIDGDFLVDNMKQLTYFGNAKPVVLEGFLEVYKTSEDGNVTIETTRFGKLTPSPDMKIEASADKVTAFDLEFDILAEKRGRNYVMCDIISESDTIIP